MPRLYSGLYNFLLASYPDIQAAVYLEEASSKFAYLKGYDEIHHETDDKEYELCICLDSSDEERLGDFNVYLKRAKKSLCIDHHVTNTRYCQVNLVAADASSASEVLFEQLNPDNVDKMWQNACIQGSYMIPVCSSIPALLQRRWRLPVS